MVRDQKRRGLTPLRFITWIGDRNVANEIGPAIPRTFAHFEQHVRHISNRTAATIVCALIDREQPAVRQKTESISVAQSPRDELELTSVFVATHYRRGAR